MGKNDLLKFDLSKLQKSLDSFDDKFKIALLAYADTSSALLESSAKENAKWEDRTGHARQRLKSDYIEVANGVKLRLMHGVDYGKWLELANEKKYSIIPKTIEIVGGFEIIPGFENFLEKLK